MKHLRVIDEIGNKHDYEAEFVPRVGEQIVLEVGRANEPVREHHYRVTDVRYYLTNPIETQVSILIEREATPTRWPS